MLSFSLLYLTYVPRRERLHCLPWCAAYSRVSAVALKRLGSVENVLRNRSVSPVLIRRATNRHQLGSSRSGFKWSCSHSGSPSKRYSWRRTPANRLKSTSIKTTVPLNPSLSAPDPNRKATLCTGKCLLRHTVCRNSALFSQTLHQATVLDWEFAAAATAFRFAV